MLTLKNTRRLLWKRKGKKKTIRTIKSVAEDSSFIALKTALTSKAN